MKQLNSMLGANGSQKVQDAGIHTLASTRQQRGSAGGSGSSPSLLLSSGSLEVPPISQRRASGRVGPIESMRERMSPVPAIIADSVRRGSFTKTIQLNARGLANRLPTMKKFIGGEDPEKRQGGDGSHRRIRRREFHFVPAEPSEERKRKMRWVIKPRSNWKIRWDLWIGFIICYSVIMVPYRIGFAVELTRWETYLNFAFDASFATDVMFNFFTGYFDGDIFVFDLPKIRLRYLKSWFIFDLLSTLPMDQFFQALTTTGDSSLLSFKLLRTIRIVRLLKLMRLLRLKRAVDTIQMDALNAHVLQTTKSLGMIILVIHLVSCGWYLFYTWDPTGINWVTFIYPDGIESPYLVCFYWVANTMMSVGYGDIYGITDGERVFSIFVECLGSISVGLIIANIQMLTENYNPRSIQMKSKLHETKEFLLKRCIPRRMRQRVISQFEYHWSHRTVFDEDKLLHNFPKSLQYEILAASMESFVKKFPFFGMTTVDFFAFTIPRLRPIMVGPGQMLVEAESVWEEVYFVVSGSLDAMRGNHVASSLSGGDICGIEYLVGTRRRYIHSYISTAKTELYAIYSSDLIEGMESCAVASKYLRDLSHIISERYSDAARRGRKILQRQESSTRRASIELFLQYRNRKSTSYNHVVHAAGLDDRKHYHISVSDDVLLHWSIIRHYSRAKLMWDAVMGIAVFWTTLSVPYRISFNIPDTAFLVATDRMADSMFLLDIVLNFFTTYLDETGVEIIDRHEIRKHYLKRSFTVDVISTIPFDFLVELITASEDFRSLKLIRTVKLVKLLRLVRIMKIFKLNSQRLSELDVSMGSVRLLKTLAPVLTIAHYVGCFWYYISADTDAKHAWWGRIYFDDPSSAFSRYVASLYWATTTMATVGFGDIYAVNSHEQLFSTFVMIGGTTMFAYIVGTVIEVVSNSKSLMNREHELGQRVNAYIKERGVSSDFAFACQEHLRYINMEKTLFDEQGLFNSLTHSMRSELILYLNSNVLSRIRFFDKKPKWFLTLLLPRLVPQYFLQGDLLIYHGNLVSGIYFLMSGTVVARLPQSSDGHDSGPSVTKDNASDGENVPSRSTTPLSQAPPRANVIRISTNGRTTDAVPDHYGTIATLHEGEFFGYKEVLTRAIAQYNVFACLATGTYMLPSDALEFISEYYPDVLEEMRRFFVHAINKQQTILQHWHNNELMGMSRAERTRILRTPDFNAGETCSDLPGVNEDEEFATPVAQEEPTPTVSDPPLASAEALQRSVSGGRRASFGNRLLSAAKLYRSRSALSSSAVDTVMANAANEPPQQRSSLRLDVNNDSKPKQEIEAQAVTGPRKSMVTPTEMVTPPPEDDVGEGELSMRMPHLSRQSSMRTGSGSTRSLSETVLEQVVKPLARRSHSRRSSLVVPKRTMGHPPPLHRHPSMPDEISALVSKLLEVEGYTTPAESQDPQVQQEVMPEALGRPQEGDHDTKEE